MEKSSKTASRDSVQTASNTPSPRYLVKTLGCKANLYDSQLIEAELKKRGWEPAEGPQDENLRLCIVNSCTVTDEADRQSRKMAARLSRDRKKRGLSPAHVVMTGCAAEVDPEKMAESPGVDLVIANRDKPRMLDLILRHSQAFQEKLDSSLAAHLFEETPKKEASAKVLGVAEGYSEMRSRHPVDREWPLPEESLLTPGDSTGGESDRTRAFLKVQDGCNAFCTYCVIPYGRGPARSLKIEDVLERVHRLVDQGFREVVITGINIGDYGKDWSEKGTPQVEALVEAILSRTSIERLRVSSMDPVEITPELTDLMKENKRFCPHFHVSLQSPHTRVLKLMKRRYRWEQVEECLERIAALPSPIGGAFIGMDVITGFPGETEEYFEWSVKALEKLPWSRLHVFPYSERAGTPATRLPGIVPMHERFRRAKVLREMSLNRLHQLYQKTLEKSRAGENQSLPGSNSLPLDSVLIEGLQRGPDGKRNWLSGYTPNYLRVLIPISDHESPDAASALTNQCVSVQPQSVVLDRTAGDVAFIASLKKS